MSVVTFAYEHTSSGATVSANLTNQDSTFTLRYVAVVDSYSDGPISIYNDPRCPKIGSIYFYGSEAYPAALCKSVHPEKQGGRYDSGSGTAGLWKWLVTVEFSTKQDDKPPGTDFAKVSFDTEQYDEVIDRDLLDPDKPVLNSAHQKFDPPPLRERCRMIVRVEKSVPGFDAGLAMYCQDAVNTTPFLGFPANSLRITKISAHPQTTQAGLLYYTLSVEMQHREISPDDPQPHQLHILDAGRYELADPTQFDKWKKITDNEGDLVADPVPLNGMGIKLAHGQRPKYLDYTRYRKIDYNLLGIYP